MIIEMFEFYLFCSIGFTMILVKGLAARIALAT
jgi:hypothetical protein